MPGSEGCQRVVLECAEIKRQHDARVDRAIKAVQLLKDRYEWKARVAAPEPEGEEGKMIDEPGEAGGDGDISMEEPQAEFVQVDNARSSVASTPASARSDEANEARVTADVLGETGPTPGWVFPTSWSEHIRISIHASYLSSW